MLVDMADYTYHYNDREDGSNDAIGNRHYHRSNGINLSAVKLLKTQPMSIASSKSIDRQTEYLSLVVSLSSCSFSSCFSRNGGALSFYSLHANSNVTAANATFDIAQYSAENCTFEYDFLVFFLCIMG